MFYLNISISTVYVLNQWLIQFIVDILCCENIRELEHKSLRAYTSIEENLIIY